MVILNSNKRRRNEPYRLTLTTWSQYHAAKDILQEEYSYMHEIVKKCEIEQVKFDLRDRYEGARIVKRLDDFSLTISRFPLGADVLKIKSTLDALVNKTPEQK